jgi:uncharacterized repeat protein (TIGR01451 family)
MRAGSRHSKRLGLTALAAVAASGVIAAPALAGVAQPGEPSYYEGNPKCADLGFDGFKPAPNSGEDNPTGTYVLPGTNGKTVTVTENQAGTGIDWTSTLGIDKVIVKGGPNANVYSYVPESFGASGLTTPDNPNPADGPYGLSHVEFCYDLLDVSKTAVPTFDRSYDWTIDKSVVGDAKTTTTGDKATFNYKVDVVKSAATDSNFKVSGTISVFNPFKYTSYVIIKDDILGRTDETCVVEGAENGLWTLPQGNTPFSYVCTLPTKMDGINRVTIEWPQEQFGPAMAPMPVGPIDTFDAPFAFGEPVSTKNNSVDVSDAFNGAAAPGTLLDGGNDITASQIFTYSRTVDVPASGCTTFPNIAYVISPDGLNKNDNASVEACRQAPPASNPPASGSTTPQPNPVSAVLGTVVAPKAKLSVSKTGPRAATAGQIVTYTIRVKNTGKANATAVVLRDLLPNGYSLAKKIKGASFKAGSLRWTFGTLAPGRTKTVKASFRIDRTIGGRRCNVAAASARGVAVVRDTACTRIAAVAGTVEPAVTG